VGTALVRKHKFGPLQEKQEAKKTEKLRKEARRKAAIRATDLKLRAKNRQAMEKQARLDARIIAIQRANELVEHDRITLERDGGHSSIPLAASSTAGKRVGALDQSGLSNRVSVSMGMPNLLGTRLVYAPTPLDSKASPTAPKFWQAYDSIRLNSKASSIESKIRHPPIPLNSKASPGQDEADSDSTSSSSISRDLGMEPFDPTLTAKIHEIAKRLLELQIARTESLQDEDVPEDEDEKICVCQGGASKSRSAPCGSGLQSQSCSTGVQETNFRNAQGKRPRTDDDERGDQEPEGSRGATTIGAPDINDEVLWACPFYKKDRIRYRSHGTVVLRTISRVKQHIKKCHQQPIHCDRCSRTFSTRPELKEHARMEPRCPLNDELEWDGTTEDQREELHKRTSRKLSEKEKWYQIYAVLFPGAPVPDSPYLEAVKSEELRELLAFADLERPRIMDDVLAGLPEYEGLQPEERRELVNAVTEVFLPLLVERFESSQAAIESSQQTEHRSVMIGPTPGLRASNVEVSPTRVGLRASPSSEYPREASASTIGIEPPNTGVPQYLVSPPATTLQFSTSLDDTLDCPRPLQAGGDPDLSRTGSTFRLSECNDSTTSKVPVSLDDSLNFSRSSQAGEDLYWSYWDGDDFSLNAEPIT
jgi:hypothetical protein